MGAMKKDQCEDSREKIMLMKDKKIFLQQADRAKFLVDQLKTGMKNLLRLELESEDQKPEAHQIDFFVFLSIFFLSLHKSYDSLRLHLLNSYLLAC